MYVCMYVCMYVYICMYVCMYVNLGPDKGVLLEGFRGREKTTQSNEPRKHCVNIGTYAGILSNKEGKSNRVNAMKYTVFRYDGECNYIYMDERRHCMRGKE